MTSEIRWLAGVDEAGRGPLAGPVVAAAVILPERHRLSGLDDSKRISPSRREELLPEIRAQAVGVGIGIVDARDIDRLNILEAAFEAMRRALAELPLPPYAVLVDGRQRIPSLPARQFPVVRGDSLLAQIAAASIVAKVTRDRLMEELDALYPAYRFARHKGYPTPEHLAALARHGPSPIHRLSFGPVRAALSRGRG